jgi:hypothetical protein
VSLPGNAWIVGSIFVLVAAMTLLVGLRVHTGEDEPEPLYKVMNVWIWLALVLLVAAAIGFGVYLVVTRQLEP